MRYLRVKSNDIGRSKIKYTAKTPNKENTKNIPSSCAKNKNGGTNINSFKIFKTNFSGAVSLLAANANICWRCIKVKFSSSGNLLVEKIKAICNMYIMNNSAILQYFCY